MNGRALYAFLSNRKGTKRSICFVTCEYPPVRGGIAKSAKRIVNHLLAAGLDVHVFTSTKRAKYSFTVEEDVAIFRVPKFKNNEFHNACAKLIQEVDQCVRFDLFHGFFLFMSYPCIPAIEKDPRPLITSIRGVDVKWIMNANSFHEEIGKVVLEHSSWVTSVSTESLDVVNGLANISDCSSFISNAIDTKNYPLWSVNRTNEGVVGTVATFREKKNIPLLVSAYSNVSPALRKKLLLVGDFHRKHMEAESKIREEIRKRSIQEEVDITGYIDNAEVPKYLLGMNVFVLSSDHEGMPNTVLEAAAAGMPIVSTSVDGVKDIFTNDVNALLVPPGNDQQLSSAIAQIIGDRDLSERLSRGSLKIAQQFNLDREKHEWLSLYNKFIDVCPGVISNANDHPHAE
jgi:glycosyltransferase involved in cell wall biosynthesis